MYSRRARFVVLGALPLILLLSSPAAATGPPADATGSFTQVGFTPSNERVVGGVFMFDFTETDVLTGTLTGTSVVEGSCVVRPTGTASCQGLETFTGTVDGRSGTAEFWNVFEVDGATGSFSGRFTALGGTGDLASLQGHGTFEGTGTIGTYALRITFAP
jgi:Protein of unknown function (DUF3224)